MNVQLNVKFLIKSSKISRIGLPSRTVRSQVHENQCYKAKQLIMDKRCTAQGQVLLPRAEPVSIVDSRTIGDHQS